MGIWPLLYPPSGSVNTLSSPPWVKTGAAHKERTYPGLPPTADSDRAR